VFWPSIGYGQACVPRSLAPREAVCRTLKRRSADQANASKVIFIPSGVRDEGCKDFGPQCLLRVIVNNDPFGRGSFLEVYEFSAFGSRVA
jgi:hypothetical protein